MVITGFEKIKTIRAIQETRIFILLLDVFLQLNLLSTKCVTGVRHLSSVLQSGFSFSQVITAFIR